MGWIALAFIGGILAMTASLGMVALISLNEHRGGWGRQEVLTFAGIAAIFVTGIALTVVDVKRLSSSPANQGPAS